MVISSRAVYGMQRLRMALGAGSGSVGQVWVHGCVPVMMTSQVLCLFGCCLDVEWQQLRLAKDVKPHAILLQELAEARLSIHHFV